MAIPAFLGGDLVAEVDGVRRAVSPSGSEPSDSWRTPAETTKSSPEPTNTADGFPGRSTPDPGIWNTTPLFQDTFPTVVPEGGAFLSAYPHWGAYPSHFSVTNRRGFYDPNLLSVKDLGNGQTALNCRLVPGSRESGGKSRGTAAYPRFPGQEDGQHLNLRWEQRVRITRKVPGWHAANLGWPIRDTDWPEQGENDYMEMDLDDPLGAFFHIYGGGSNGDGQIRFSAPWVDTTEWFTVGFELIAGTSYKWLVNGKQVGETVPASKVPNYPQRIVLQLEDDGGPTEEANVQYDWVTAWSLKTKG